MNFANHSNNEQLILAGATMVNLGAGIIVMMYIVACMARSAATFSSGAPDGLYAMAITSALGVCGIAMGALTLFIGSAFVAVDRMFGVT
jgi:hypothetical protein